MKTLEYVKNHFDEFEQYNVRFTKRFLDFLPMSDFEKFGFAYIGEKPFVQKAWTEENVIEQLKEDVFFGHEKAVSERGISSEIKRNIFRNNGNGGQFVVQDS